MRPDLSELNSAVVKTLTYSDIFDHPLRLTELHRYLTIPAGLEALTESLQQNADVETKDGFYFLPGRAALVDVRRQREADSLPAFNRAMKYGRFLGSLPFIRMTVKSHCQHEDQPKGQAAAKNVWVVAQAVAAQEPLTV